MATVEPQFHRSLQFDGVDEASIKPDGDGAIPVIDLSSFFQDHHSNPSVVQLRESVIQQITEASQEWGFFQVINHGICVDVIEEALATSRLFFEKPVEEKIKARPGAGESPFPTGYNLRPPGSHDHSEYLFFFGGDSESGTDLNHGNAKYNVFPNDPPHFRFVIEKLLSSTAKAATLIESLISQSLGLPPTFLHESNEDNSKLLILLYYPLATDHQDIGLTEHRDGSYLTIVGQEHSGYQVLKDGKWVDITPIRGALVINIGDILQVWSNNRLKSVLHRVVSNRLRSRCSFAFSLSPALEKQVEALPHFTTHINIPPAYRPFLYRDYFLQRIKNKTHPPAKVEEMVDISTYAV